MLAVASAATAGRAVAGASPAQPSKIKAAPVPAPAGWLRYRNSEHGVTLYYPPDWGVAPKSLTPALADPREIVSLGTYPELDPSDHNCAQIPVNALERLGPDDAFISIQERQQSLHEPGTPQRPRRFGPNTGLDGASTDVVGCLSARPPASIRWIHFAANQREFYVIVAVGENASQQRRADTYRILDTMIITTTADLPPASLPCEAVIGSQDHLHDGQSEIADSVAITTGRALQANRSGETDPTARLFAKNGLLIRPASTFELLVPTRWRPHLTMAWGGTRRTTRLQISDCAHNSDAHWLAYAGGYYIDHPACVSLIVRANGKDHRAHIGIGAACPGQQPPSPGTD